jgi:hypothetical protein
MTPESCIKLWGHLKMEKDIFKRRVNELFLQ